MLSSKDVAAAISTVLSVGNYDTAQELIDDFRVRLLCETWVALEKHCKCDDLAPEEFAEVQDRVRKLLDWQVVAQPSCLADGVVLLHNTNRQVSDVGYHDLVAQQVFGEDKDLTYKIHYGSLELHAGHAEMYGCTPFSAGCYDLRLCSFQRPGMLTGYEKFLIDGLWVTTFPSTDTVEGLCRLELNNKAVYQGPLCQLRKKIPVLKVIDRHSQIEAKLDHVKSSVDTLLYINFDGWGKTAVY